MPTPEEVIARFHERRLKYASRNGAIDYLQSFFEGEQWSQSPSEEDDEIQLVLNYTREAILYHVGYLTRKIPRVDVPSRTDSVKAQARENYVNSILRSVWTCWPSMEMDTNKFGYAVLELLWTGEPVSEESSDKLETFSTFKKVPFTVRVIDPRCFYPRYRTYDHPDDFLWVIRHDPDRLTEDIFKQYGVDVQSTKFGDLCDLVEYWDEDTYILLALSRSKSRKSTSFVVLKNEAHPYGRPPFFVLPNMIDPHKDFTVGGGLSEIESVQEAARHLNMIFTLSAQEITNRIHPPVVYTADGKHSQSPADIRMGAGEVIPLRTDEAVTPIHWPGIPHSVTEHRNATVAALRDMAKLPRTSFGASVEAPSGIGMRLMYEALEITLSLKVPIRERVISEMLQWALEITEQQLGDKGKISYHSADVSGLRDITLFKRDIEGDFFCVTTFNVTPPRDKITFEQHVAYLFKLKVISLMTALEMLEDVKDPAAEVARLRKELQDSILHPEQAVQPANPTQTNQLGDIKQQEGPPVPALPSMPTQQNAPFLGRGLPPNMSSTGLNQGPPIEEQP